MAEQVLFEGIPEEWSDGDVHELKDVDDVEVDPEGVEVVRDED